MALWLFFFNYYFTIIACSDENELDIPTNDSENEIEQEDGDELEYYVEGNLLFFFACLLNKL